MSFDQRPIIALVACPEHRPDDTEVMHTGPEGTDREIDFVAETLMCWRCWESDEAGILAHWQSRYRESWKSVAMRSAGNRQ